VQLIFLEEDLGPRSSGKTSHFHTAVLRICSPWYYGIDPKSWEGMFVAFFSNLLLGLLTSKQFEFKTKLTSIYAFCLFCLVVTLSQTTLLHVVFFGIFRKEINKYISTMKIVRLNTRFEWTPPYVEHFVTHNDFGHINTPSHNEPHNFEHWT